MTVGGIISALIFGLILGVLGRMLAPGKQKIPVWMTILVGMVAALVGTAIVGGLQDTDGLDWVEIVVQIGLAVVFVMAAAGIYEKRKSKT